MIDAILAATRLGFPADLLIKATMVLATAAGVTLLMSRASAATRHLVWAIGIAASLSLPFLAMIVPRWEIPLELATTTSLEAPASGPAFMSGSEAGIAGEASFPSRPDDATAGTSAVPGSAGAEAFGAPAESGMDWPAIAIGVWALGVLLLVSRQIIGWLGTRRLERNAQRVEDPEWQGLLRDASWLLDVDREVVLLRGGAASMPMTWGTRRPAILIPTEADSWPIERRRVVLLHEMAHIARRDCLTQAITEFACALYWFHPLAWMAARAMRTERERACDDLVLAAGEHASDYAGHLLEVARSYRGHPVYSAAAIGMARPSQLEGRLLAVLDAARRRGAPRRREVGFALGLATVILVPLAAIRTVEAKEISAAAPGEGKLLQQLQAAIGQSSAESKSALLPAGQPDEARSARGSAADTVITLSVETLSGGNVVLDIENGANLFITGYDGKSVELRAELRGSTADGTQIELTSRDGEVRLFSEYRGNRRGAGGNHVYELRVPVFSNLDIESAGGSVNIDRVSGTFTGGTGGGSITLERTAGQANLRTGGGNIRVSNSRLNGEVTTGGGNVTVLGNEGDLQGRTGGGDVRIENSAPSTAAQANVPTRIQTGGGDIDVLDVRGEAELATGGGDISVQSVGGSLTATTGAGDIRIGRAAASVTANSGSGDIAVGAVAGSARARTGNGSIRLGLASSPESRTIDLQSGSGDIVLEVPVDFAGSFDIVINGGRPRAEQIRSDIPLSTEPGNGGVLRASGRTGSGNSRVTIRTSSGNVTIRRGGSSANANPGMNANTNTASARRNSAVDAHELEIAIQNAVSREVPAPHIPVAHDHELDIDIDNAFDKAFDEEFERNIETMVNASIGSFANGIVRFTTNITSAALAEAVAALERADRAGALDEDDREELRELRRGMRELEAELR